MFASWEAGGTYAGAYMEFPALLGLIVVLPVEHILACIDFVASQASCAISALGTRTT